MKKQIHLLLYGSLISGYCLIESNVKASSNTQTEMEAKILDASKCNFSVRKCGARCDDLSGIYSNPDYQPIGPATKISVTFEEMAAITIDHLVIDNGQARVTTNPQDASLPQSAFTNPFLGIDGRTLVTNTNEWPHSVHGHMLMKISDQTYTGSGVMVGPRHVLTAAHNLYNRKKSTWASEIFFASGRHQDRFPFANAKAIKLLVTKEWFESRSSEKIAEANDLGLVILDHPLGHYTGWSGLLSLPNIILQHIPVSVTGYPADKGSGSYKSTEMFTMTRGLKALLDDQQIETLLSQPEMLSYRIDTYEGQSGGQIGLHVTADSKWFNAGFYTVGIHAYGKDKTNLYNRGVHLSKNKFKWISNGIENHLIEGDKWNAESPSPNLSSESIIADLSKQSFYQQGPHHEWIERAIQGEANALFMLASTLEEKNDYESAWILYEESAKRKYTPAYAALGKIYQAGLSKPQNFFKSIGFFLKAGNKEVNVSRKLSEIFADEKHGFKHYRLPKSIEYLEQAVENDDEKACFDLAAFYRDGKDVYQDVIYAERLLQKARNKGYIVPDDLQPAVKKHPRPWKKVETQKIVNNLHKVSMIEQFMEAYPERSDKSYLTLLWEKLHEPQSTTLTIKASKKTSVAGMGGIGKTSLATQYAHEASDYNAYKIIYWIAAETEEKITEGYRSLLSLLDIYSDAQSDIDKLMLLINQKLSEKQWQPYLLIYDNVPDSPILKSILPSLGGHIIITSRCQEGWGNILNLDVFSPEYSIQYLLRKKGIKENLEDMKILKELVKELGCLPLALSHASSYIDYRRNRSTEKEYQFKDYLESFKAQPTEHFVKLMNPHDENICNGFTIDSKYLVNKTVNMAQAYIRGLSTQLLIYFAYLEPDQICVDAFLEYAKNDENSLRESIAELSAFSLIKTGTKVSMHRLVQLVIRNEYEATNVVPNFSDVLLSFWMYLEPIKQEVEKSKQLKVVGDNNQNQAVNKKSLNINELEKNYQKLSILSSNLATFYGHLTHSSKANKDNLKIFFTNVGNSFIQKHLEGILVDLRGLIFNFLNKHNAYLQNQQLLEQLSKDADKKLGLQISKELSQIITETIPFMHQYQLRHSDLEYIAKCYKQVKDTIPEYLTEFTKRLHNLLSSQKYSNNDYIVIIYQCRQIKLFEYPLLIDAITYNTEEQMDKYDRACVVAALAKVRIYQCREFANLLKSLLQDQMPLGERTRLIKALIQVPEDQWQKVVNNLESLLVDQMDGYERSRLIENLIKIPAKTFIDQDYRIFDTKWPSTNEIPDTKWPSTNEIPDTKWPSTNEIPDTKWPSINEISDTKWPSTNEIPDTKWPSINEISDTKWPSINEISDTKKSSINITSKVDDNFLSFSRKSRLGQNYLYLDDLRDQHQEVADNLALLLPDQMSGYDRTIVIKALLKVPADERQEFAASIKPLLTEQMFGWACNRMIATWIKVPADERQELAANIKPLLTAQMSRDGRASVIEALLKVPADERQELATNITSLLTNQMSGYDRAIVIKALLEVPADKRQEFAASIKSLLPDQMSEADRTIVIKALLKVPAGERQKFDASIKSLLPDQMSGYDRAIVIEALLKVLAGERQKFATSIKLLLPDQMSGYDRAIVIKALLEVPADERQKFAASIKSLLPDQMSGKDHANVIKSLLKVPAGERQKFAASIKLLLPDQMSGYDRAIVIEALLKVPAGERQKFAASIKPLLMNNMDRMDRSRMIEALLKVSVDERQEFAASIKPLLPDQMSGYDRIIVIKALLKVPADERQEFAASITALLPDNMNGDACASLIEELLKVPADKRQELAVDIKLLLTAQVSGDGRVSVIGVLLKMPAGERQKFAASITALLPDQMSGYDRIIVIKALLKVPADERQELAANIKPLLTAQMSGDARASMIVALLEVPAGKRSEFVHSITALLMDKMDGDAYASVIEALLKVPAGERQEFAASITALLPDKISRWHRARVRVIEALLKVPAGERQELKGILLRLKNCMLAEKSYQDNDWCTLLKTLLNIKFQKQLSVFNNIFYFLNNFNSCDEKFKSYLLIPILREDYMQKNSIKIFEDIQY